MGRYGLTLTCFFTFCNICSRLDRSVQAGIKIWYTVLLPLFLLPLLQWLMMPFLQYLSNNRNIP